MEFKHKSVLLDECIEYLNINPEGVYIDGTIGGAGHSSEIYGRLNSKGLLIGLDQDGFAVEASAKRLDEIKSEANYKIVNTNFKHIKKACGELGVKEADGILLDLGVSSHQLDEASRGFSYQQDAPLDMRMDTKAQLSAYQVVNEYSEQELYRIIRDFGEEKWASRIAKFIAEAREVKPIATTYDLVDIIKKAVPSAARRDGPHPAKRTFQAIRIAVNHELDILNNTIADCVALLKSGGRLCIITFHSLEDRIVKVQYAKYVNPCTCPPSFPVCVCGGKPEAVLVNRKPIVSSEQELESNPRARSAKLRVLQKI
ncbi:16S rRNA (cytosine1402-N4)-methyltransferase [Ruminiclostridium sufflavum DSM 19573]|uniref:Ribosomal RNA small subunit methyltransferase H n=1 Tax=Ruminiclostridium sufflavum DSM 19573 TaxID=1121337 RepID=A0A318XLC5_9FIRM|nr:16S rRNA (cytosine(1402)-N(4))-methyltransferase RsmH [Ruminiclostridium sufflavum]PYG88433.1 16S rRNA (cytosine1402-N4)-methyltransferase [Ruminiclostridium sufflavum DSM 19573]